MSHETNLTPFDIPAQIEFKATPLAVRSTLAQVRAIWCGRDLANGLCKRAEQVLAEVLNNVVEHAQANRPDGIVQLGTSGSEGGLICFVRDNGAAMPGGQLPDGDLAEIGDDLDSLPEGGFGWFMIRSMTQGLRYERANGWNHLYFFVPQDET